MAKPSTSPPKETPALPPRIVCKSILDHPEQLPPRVAAALSDGWTLLAIVACRHSNEHAAYLSRTDVAG